jgi:poly(ADP-ribose) glycohydrolase
MATSSRKYTLPHGEAKWSQIKDQLEKLSNGTVKGVQGLREVIAISPQWANPNPPILNTLGKVLNDGEHWNIEEFGDDILPYIAKRAMEVETLFPEKTIDLLTSGLTGGISLTRHQTSCILSLAFFNLLSPVSSKGGSRYQHLTLINIIERGFFTSQFSKCLCIIGYFHRLLKEEKAGNDDYMKRCISIERKVLDRDNCKADYWKNSDILLGPVKTNPDGLIEEASGTLQVDFANEFIGGGVLAHGNVQEEIRFMINPECLVSCLLCEAMAKDEAILITGAEQFSSYKGYGGNFTYAGPFTDANPLDVLMNRASVSIVAIDAIPAAWLPGGASYQFEEAAILREVSKAYCGFSFQVVGDTSGGTSRVPVATGNWGCGAFGGNKELKTLIQWMACSQANREMLYYTFRDKRLVDRQLELIECLTAAKVTVGQLYQVLTDKDFIDKVYDKGAFAYVMDKFKT